MWKLGSMANYLVLPACNHAKIGLKLLTSEMLIDKFSVRLVEAISIHLFFLSHKLDYNSTYSNVKNKRAYTFIRTLEYHQYQL